MISYDKLTTEKNWNDIMKSQSIHKINRNGAWQPYIPTLGVATGCRTGPRNESERFNIAYIAERFQDDQHDKRGVTPVLPMAAKCAFNDSSMIPVSDGSNQRSEWLRTVRPSRKNEGALEAGLVPVGSADTWNLERKHRGEMSRQTGCVVGRQSTPFDSGTNAGYRVPRRTNDQTLKPPDNLSIDLQPYEKYSIKARNIKRSEDIDGRSTSLGRGLIPLSRTKDEPEAKCESCARNKPGTYESGYARVYGLYAKGS